MSQSDPAATDPRQELSRAIPEEQIKQIGNAFGRLVENITPWLVEFGSWLFGGLIAFNLLVVAALITVGPVDPAILVSTVAFAVALPLELVGLILLRLDQDLKNVKFEEEVAQAFQEVAFPGKEQVTSPTAFQARRKRRTQSILFYSLGILALSFVLTITGTMAALWHMAWWIGVVFLAMVLLSQGIVIVALATLQPPDPAKRQERKRRSGDAMASQAKEHD